MHLLYSLKCSGQAAALAGGTTMHIDFALPLNGSLTAGLTEWRRKAAIAVMDYGFHMAITSWDQQVSANFGIENTGRNFEPGVGALVAVLIIVYGVHSCAPPSSAERCVPSLMVHRPCAGSTKPSIHWRGALQLQVVTLPAAELLRHSPRLYPAPVPRRWTGTFERWRRRASTTISSWKCLVVPLSMLFFGRILIYLPVHLSDFTCRWSWWRRASTASCPSWCVLDLLFALSIFNMAFECTMQVERDMEALAAAGVNSFKFFMAYKGILQVTDEQLLRGFAKCRQLGALPQVGLRQGRTNPSWTLVSPVFPARSVLPAPACMIRAIEILCFLCGQVHAEHGDAIFMAQQSTFDAGITGPEGHAISRPAVLEVLSRCAELEQGMAPEMETAEHLTRSSRDVQRRCHS